MAATVIEARDLQQVIASLDAAICVFARYQGRLNVTEIRIQSMITVLRNQLLEELGESGEKSGPRPRG